MEIPARRVNSVYKLERLRIVKIIRGGLISILPILLVGSFALICMSFPVREYIDFIKTFGGGFLYTIFNIIHKSAFGMLSVYMTVSISVSYCNASTENRSFGIETPVTALACFFVLSGVFSENFDIIALGPQGMVTAILAGYAGSALFSRLYKRFGRFSVLLSDGADIQLNHYLFCVLPCGVTVIIFALISAVISFTFNVDTIYELLTLCVTSLFSVIGRNFFGGALMVLLSSVLWFFGIHGSNCLEGAMQEVFSPAIDINAAAYAAGNAPTEILTKQFFDVFIFMGGCGAAMCLLIAILLFSKRRSTRKLSYISSFTMLFNVNETMIFGLPVILNPFMFIPFVLTPLVCYFTTYAAMSLGIVGLTVSSVEWTTPVLMGGYIAVDSISGLLLQLFNLALGVAIYTPFVKLTDRHQHLSAIEDYNDLLEYYKNQEHTGSGEPLIKLYGDIGRTARQLVQDLNALFRKGRYGVHYQPQYNAQGVCIGVEALLRWKHSMYGYIYPPLIIKLARESNNIVILEKAIIIKVFTQYKQITDALGTDITVSVNVTETTLTSEGFTEFLIDLKSKTGLGDLSAFCLEITEQTALNFNADNKKILKAIKGTGCTLAIDDFTMGQTSVNYLKEQYFDYVKLDGSLVSDITNNRRCLDIIASIVKLSEALSFNVIAEYVETHDQMCALKEVGCVRYQGFLFSPAVSLEELNGKKSGQPK